MLDLGFANGLHHDPEQITPFVTVLTSVQAIKDTFFAGCFHPD